MSNSIEQLADLTDFFMEIDALKSVERRSYIGGGARLENSAEHSWHLAMACWTLARRFDLPVSEEKLIKLALVHDLGEIDAGDTFLYAKERSDAHQQERRCVARLAAHDGNNIDELNELWEEQETGSSLETRLLKVADRLLPFLLNVKNEGRTWRDLGVSRSQVLAAHAFIADEFEPIHAWMLAQIDNAVARGWLKPD
ncbi:HD domain-containing protein [Marinobacterium mangrovicola]|uniref:5'-deoxynucleotidase n=1 Tax=Marinobacterium mangrovicola TaxID=1476959 RepID=A0A4V2PE96_9GAMM|nr:HD domain-containing protein [Marinobacterium mangrovicola]TCK08236.1 putative hydrolase of HD superfamily [Marinobacterium mangrovicola]